MNIALGAAWIARALVREPIIFDLSNAAAFLGVLLISLTVLYFFLSSRHTAAKGHAGGFAAKVGRMMVLVVFALAMGAAQIGIGYALADIIGFRTEFDYVEPYEVVVTDSGRNQSLTLEARASYTSTLLNIVRRTGSPFWFSLCAAPGEVPPALPEEASAYHIVDRQRVPLKVDFVYDEHRHPRRRPECTSKELRIFLDVPDRERLCVDLSFSDDNKRSCWDLVRERDEGVTMLREALRL